MNPKTRLATLQRQVDRALDRWLPSEKTRPVTLHRAMRYGIFAGGKRLRPVLCLAAAEACGGKSGPALPAACAVECIHTYSLIHDDLPCMDDDDLRRGRPTTHKVFGEAVAVLAGDALMTIAFEILAQTKATKCYGLQDFFLELATSAGSSLLVGGQVADMEAENRTATPKDLLFIHRGKTAAMIAASLRLGAMSANAAPGHLKALGKFGEHLGLAFQIVDDILDITQSSEQLGKSAGKDASSGKATYPSVFGLEKSRREASRLTKAALKDLDPLGPKADFLRSFAEDLLERRK
jgi:geranylgeranyl diphosphate synthase, type II